MIATDLTARRGSRNQTKVHYTIVTQVTLAWPARRSVALK